MTLTTDLPTSKADGDANHTAGHNATNTAVNAVGVYLNARDRDVYAVDYLTPAASASANRAALQAAVDAAQTAGKGLCLDGVDVDISTSPITVTGDDLRIWSAPGARITQTTVGVGIFLVSGERFTIEGVALAGDDALDLDVFVNTNGGTPEDYYGVRFTAGAHGGTVRNCTARGLFIGVAAFPESNFTNPTGTVNINDLTVDGLEVVNVWSAVRADGLTRARVRNVKGSYKVATGVGADPHLVYISSFADDDTPVPVPRFYNTDIHVENCSAYDGEQGQAFSLRYTKGATWDNLRAYSCPGVLQCIDVQDFVGGDVLSARDTFGTSGLTIGAMYFSGCQRGHQGPALIDFAAGQRGSGIGVEFSTDVVVDRARVNLRLTSPSGAFPMVHLDGVNVQMLRPQLTSYGSDVDTAVIIDNAGYGGSCTVVDPVITGAVDAIGVRATTTSARVEYDPLLVEGTDPVKMTSVGTPLFIKRVAAAQLTAGWGSRFFPAVPNIQYSADILGAGTRTSGLTYQQARATPIYCAELMTINKLIVNCTTATASSVYRMGIWQIDNQNNPFTWTAAVQWATLLVDAGTVSTATTGAKVLTLGTALTVPADTWLAIGGVPQVATGAQLTISDYETGAFSPLGGNGFDAFPAITAQPNIVLAQTGVTGALGNFTPSGGEPTGHGVCFYRSA